jgi:(4S)-4-hydroxy-5-phosphonooxypentane-2,3-dione isomerase
MATAAARTAHNHRSSKRMAKITFVARMTCKADKQREFVNLCRQLESYVRANEPDTLQYEFFKLREPGRYLILESFRDEAAEHLHMNSKTLAEIAPKLSACLDGTWVREYFDALEST